MKSQRAKKVHDTTQLIGQKPDLKKNFVAYRVHQKIFLMVLHISLHRILHNDSWIMMYSAIEAGTFKLSIGALKTKIQAI